MGFLRSIVRSLFCCENRTGAANRDPDIRGIVYELQRYEKNGKKNEDLPSIPVHAQLPAIPTTDDGEHDQVVTEHLWMLYSVHWFYDYLVATEQITEEQVVFAAQKGTMEEQLQTKYDQILGNDIPPNTRQNLANSTPAHEQSALTVPKILGYWGAKSANILVGYSGYNRGNDNFSLLLEDILFPLGSDFTEVPSREDESNYMSIQRLLIQYPNYLIAHWIWDKEVALRKGLLRFASVSNGTTEVGYHMYRVGTGSGRQSREIMKFGNENIITRNRLTGLVASIVRQRNGSYYNKIMDNARSYTYGSEADENDITKNFGPDWVLQSEYCHFNCLQRETLPGDIPANRCEALFHGVLGDNWLNSSLHKGCPGQQVVIVKQQRFLHMHCKCHEYEGNPSGEQCKITTYTDLQNNVTLKSKEKVGSEVKWYRLRRTADE